MSDNAFGGETEHGQPEEREPQGGQGHNPGSQQADERGGQESIQVPDDASELLDGSLDEAPAEPMPGSDSGFAGDVGDALPGGEQPATPPEQTVREAAAATPGADDRVSALTADLQRLNAEYVNYKRRVERDKETARAATIGSVVESLIPVLDDIFAAREHGDLADGPFARIAEKLEAILERHGVTQVGAEGETFDPTRHEAMVQMQADLPEGTTETTVVKVMQPGFKVGDRIVRPARVAVAEPGQEG